MTNVGKNFHNNTMIFLYKEQKAKVTTRFCFCRRRSLHLAVFPGLYSFLPLIEKLMTKT